MSALNRYSCGAVLLCAILLLAAHSSSLGAAPRAGVLIEGFEDASKVRRNGAVSIISDGPGPTEGKSAARLDIGGAIGVDIPRASIAKLPWLRMDTLHDADETQGIAIAVSSGVLLKNVRGYVAGGKDTLAYPLSMIIPAAAPVGAATAKITITNISKKSIVIDNIRLEQLVRTPPGAVLWDFGGAKNQVWPGFTAHGISGNGVKWKDDPSYYSGYRALYPDPLTWDFIGPYSETLGNGARIPVAITAPEARSTYAWLWLTHYGKRYTQPQEYLCRAAKGRPVGRKLTAAQMVGPDGLLEGSAGDWTPQWYATDYADHFVTLMPFAMPKGKGVLELGNCQMAALAMVPAAGRSAMSSCIKQIQSELVRFRRQFVMKHLERNRCDLEPTEAEKKAGMMLLRPPHDEAFSGIWKPRADQRIWTLRELASPGGTVHIPLAFVPLKRKSVSFSVISSSLRSESKATLTLSRSNLRTNHMHLVPAVREGITTRRPWLLGGRSQPVAVGDIGYIWLTASIPRLTKEGIYRGTWKLGSGTARINLPVEIEIVNCGQQDKKGTEDFTIASFGLPSASIPYSYALAATPKSKQLKLKSNVFKQVTAAGVNAYKFRGVEISAGSTSRSYILSTADSLTDLREFPLKDLSGPMFVNMIQAMLRLGWGTTEEKKALLIRAIAQSNALCVQYGIDKRYFYLGYSDAMADGTRMTGLTTRLAGARRFAADDCRTAVHTLSSILKNFSPAEFNASLTPVSALIITPNSSSTASQIEAFQKLPGIRKIYLYTKRADRYTMGFYSALVQADGCILPSAFMNGGTYNGYKLDGAGLTALQPGGKLTQTVSALRIRQAQSDRELVAQARSLVSRAVQASIAATEITAVLTEIKSRGQSAGPLEYDSTRFGTTSVSHAEMDSWRASLLNAMGLVSKRIPGARR